MSFFAHLCLIALLSVVALIGAFRMQHCPRRKVQTSAIERTICLCYARDSARDDEVLTDFLEILYRKIRTEKFVSLSFTNKKEYLSKVSLPASWNTKKVVSNRKGQEGDEEADENQRKGEDASLSIQPPPLPLATSVDLGNGLINIQGRLVLIKGETRLQLHAKYKRCDQVKNFAIDASSLSTSRSDGSDGSKKRPRKRGDNALPPSKDELIAILSSGGFRKVEMMTIDTKYTLRLKCSYVESTMGGSEGAEPVCVCTCAAIEERELVNKIERGDLSHDKAKPTAVQQLLSKSDGSTNQGSTGNNGSNGGNSAESSAGEERAGPAVGAYLQLLGVTNAKGTPVKGKGDKLRQIRKFSEIVDSLVDRACLTGTINSISDDGSTSNMDGSNGSDELLVLDAGCGMGYLTFSTHELLYYKLSSSSSSTRVLTLGVENRPGLVLQTNSIARSMGKSWEGLSFACAQIDQLVNDDGVFGTTTATGGSNDEEGKRLLELYRQRVDVVIALHACDTATDDALLYALRNRARVVMTAPCCQKELRGQINEVSKRGRDGGGAASNGSDGSTHTSSTAALLTLRPLLSHGIYRERFTEMLTDALRALVLEREGYSVTVMEFISSEHTAKNTMITAVLPPESQRESQDSREGEMERMERIEGEIRQLCATFNIRKQSLLERMGLQHCLYDGGMRSDAKVKDGANRKMLRRTRK